MNNKTTFTSILKVSASNILKLLSGVLVGFLLPKIIGVEDYGLYKTFTLYGTYVGLFALGITDGIYLKYGGFDFEKLDKKEFRMYTRLYFITELILAVILLFGSLILLKNESRFIFSCLSVFMLGQNITGYYQIISQITSRFSEFSFRTIIQSVLTIVSIIVLFFIHFHGKIELTYKCYTIISILIIIFLTIWYIYTYRDITFGETTKFNNNWGLYFSFIKIGVPLLIANLCSLFILTIDRQFVNALFDVQTYAVYAFAYNMLSLITTALSAISTVLYPVMKKMNEKTLIQNYDIFISLILIIVFCSLVVYFPLVWFVGWFLPKYTGSLVIFRIILPAVAISSSISIIMHNYYKTLNIEKKFFIKSVVILGLSIIANYLAYLIFRTTIAISIASIIVIVVWYIIAEAGIPEKWNHIRKKNYLFIIIMLTGFYIITLLDNWIISLLLYTALYVMFTWLLFYTDLKKAKSILTNS